MFDAKRGVFPLGYARQFRHFTLQYVKLVPNGSWESSGGMVLSSAPIAGFGASTGGRELSTIDSSLLA